MSLEELLTGDRPIRNVLIPYRGFPDISDIEGYSTLVNGRYYAPKLTSCQLRDFHMNYHLDDHPDITGFRKLGPHSFLFLARATEELNINSKLDIVTALSRFLESRHNLIEMFKEIARSFMLDQRSHYYLCQGVGHDEPISLRVKVTLDLPMDPDSKELQDEPTVQTKATATTNRDLGDQNVYVIWRETITNKHDESEKSSGNLQTQSQTVMAIKDETTEYMKGYVKANATGGYAEDDATAFIEVTNARSASNPENCEYFDNQARENLPLTNREVFRLLGPCLVNLTQRPVPYFQNLIFWTSILGNLINNFAYEYISDVPVDPRLTYLIKDHVIFSEPPATDDEWQYLVYSPEIVLDMDRNRDLMSSIAEGEQFTIKHMSDESYDDAVYRSLLGRTYITMTVYNLTRILLHVYKTVMAKTLEELLLKWVSPKKRDYLRRFGVWEDRRHNTPPKIVKSAYRLSSPLFLDIISSQLNLDEKKERPYFWALAVCEDKKCTVRDLLNLVQRAFLHYSTGEFAEIMRRSEKFPDFHDPLFYPLDFWTVGNIRVIEELYTYLRAKAIVPSLERLEIWLESVLYSKTYEDFRAKYNEKKELCKSNNSGIKEDYEIAIQIPPDMLVTDPKFEAYYSPDDDTIEVPIITGYFYALSPSMLDFLLRFFFGDLKAIYEEKFMTEEQPFIEPKLFIEETLRHYAKQKANYIETFGRDDIVIQIKDYLVKPYLYFYTSLLRYLAVLRPYIKLGDQFELTPRLIPPPIGTVEIPPQIEDAMSTPTESSG